MSDYLTTTGNGFSTFPKLTNENYHTWKINMTTLLRGLNQYTMVNGSSTRPPGTDAAAVTAQSAWDLRAARAYMEIALRVENEWKQPIAAADTPKAAWDALADAYGVAQEGIRAVLFSQLTSLRYKPGTPIQNHQLKMEELRAKLKDAGQDITDEQFLSYFLNTLPSEYDALVTMVDYSTDKVNTVVGRIRQMELRREMHSEEQNVKPGDTAFVGKDGKSKNPGDEKKKRQAGKCHNCGKKGHWAKECRGPKREKTRGMIRNQQERRQDQATLINQQDVYSRRSRLCIQPAQIRVSTSIRVHRRTTSQTSTCCTITRCFLSQSQ